MNHAHDSSLTPDQLAAEEALDLAAIQAVDWSEPYPTGEEWRGTIESGRWRNAVVLGRPIVMSDQGGGKRPAKKIGKHDGDSAEILEGLA
jgi:hypothetical protein